jgi:hypothetical protein
MKQAHVQKDLTRRALSVLASFAANAKAQDHASGQAVKTQSSWVAHLHRLVFELLIFVLLVALVAVVVKSTLKHATVIEPINVPPELASRGYTGTVVAQQLIDEVYAVVFNAQTTRAIGYRSHKPQSAELLPSVASNLAVPQIEVPGTGISMGAVIYYLRDLFGIYDTKITGEIVRENTVRSGNEESGPPIYTLHLRSSEQAFYFRSPKPDRKLENILEAAALPLLEKLSPYIAGVAYWRKSDLTKAAAMAQQSLNSDSIDERKWGMNLRGLISDAHKRHSEARDRFIEALDLFPNFAQFYYNRGSVEYHESRYLTALAASLDGASVDDNPTLQSRGYAFAALALDGMRRNGVPFKSNHHLSQLLDNLFGYALWPPLPDETAADMSPSGQTKVTGAEALGLKEGEIPSPRAIGGVFRRAIQTDPTQPVPFFNLGMLEYETNDRPNAEEHMEIAVSLFSEKDPAEWKSEAHDILGQLYANEKDADEKKFDAAFAEFKMATELGNKPALPLLHWAQALAKRAAIAHASKTAAESFRNDAAEKLERAIGIAPDNDELRKAAAETFAQLKMNERAKKLLEPTASPSSAVGASLNGRGGILPTAVPAGR